MLLIVAGVAGSGKTTVGALLAGRLSWQFADADTFHPDANIAKMRAGVPLTDADRQPWLGAVTDWMDARIAAGEPSVVTCSALKRAYRDQLLGGRPAVMVFLQVSREVLARRLSARHGHFFPAKLLDSQLADVEPPAPDERVLTVPAEGDPERTAAHIISLLPVSISPGGMPPRLPAPDAEPGDPPAARR